MTLKFVIDNVRQTDKGGVVQFSSLILQGVEYNFGKTLAEFRVEEDDKVVSEDFKKLAAHFAKVFKLNEKEVLNIMFNNLIDFVEENY